MRHCSFLLPTSRSYAIQLHCKALSPGPPTNASLKNLRHCSQVPLRHAITDVISCVGTTLPCTAMSQKPASLFSSSYYVTQSHKSDTSFASALPYRARQRLKNYVIVLSYYVRPTARHCLTNVSKTTPLFFPITSDPLRGTCPTNVLKTASLFFPITSDLLLGAALPIYIKTTSLGFFLLHQAHCAALPYQCLKNYVIVLSY